MAIRFLQTFAWLASWLRSIPFFPSIYRVCKSNLDSEFSRCWRLKSLYLCRICLLGNKLLASNSYHECARNDTLLNATYGNDETFWSKNPLSYVIGVPGIPSGLFSGKVILICFLNNSFNRSVCSYVHLFNHSFIHSSIPLFVVPVFIP